MTRSSEYALRALVYLAQHQDGQPVPGREIARATKIPAKYLQKILGDLTRAGILDSAPGKSGGFRFGRSASKIPLSSVLAPFERAKSRHCPFGNTICNDKSPCGAHKDWKKVVEAEQRFFTEMTIGDVAKPVG